MAGPIKKLKIRRLDKQATEARKKMNLHDAQSFRVKSMSGESHEYDLQRKEYKKWKEKYKKIQDQINNLK